MHTMKKLRMHFQNIFTPRLSFLLTALFMRIFEVCVCICEKKRMGETEEMNIHG